MLSKSILAHQEEKIFFSIDFCFLIVADKEGTGDSNNKEQSKEERLIPLERKEASLNIPADASKQQGKFYN